MAENNISDLRLEQYLTGTLSDDGIAEVKAALSRDAALQTRLSEIEEQRRAFYRQVPPAEFAHGGLGTEYLLMGLSVGGAILAWHLARKRYGADRPKDWAEREQALPGFKLLNAKYYVDEIYDASFVRAVLTLRKVFAEMDRWIVDGLVNAAGTVSRAAAWATGVHDKYVVDGLVNLVGNATLGAGGQLRRIQTGRIQNYVYGILGGVLFFALLRYFLR